MTPRRHDTPPARTSAPLWALALITFSGTVAMHIFVPALPIASADLHTSSATIQMTVSLYIVGLAVGQLIYGPLSDRFGRRPVLMAGLALYTLAGLAAALAPDVYSLIAARLFQALGGCSGLVLARAIVRDTAAGPRQAAQRLALMNLMVTVGPGMAPLIGSALATGIGWRSIFYLLVALGMANFLFTWRLLPETNRPSATPRGSTLKQDYLRLLRSPVFLGFTLGGGCATTSIYAFISSAPFLFTEQLHRPAERVGLYLAILVLGMALGNALASRLMGRFNIRRVMVYASLLSALAGLAFLGLALAGQLSLGRVLGTVFLFTLGAGIASPATLTEAISVVPHLAGSASGLYGFTQMAIGAACAALAVIGPNPALGAAFVLAGAGVIAQLSFWIALRASRRAARHGG